MILGKERHLTLSWLRVLAAQFRLASQVAKELLGALFRKGCEYIVHGGKGSRLPSVLFRGGGIVSPHKGPQVERYPQASIAQFYLLLHLCLGEFS